MNVGADINHQQMTYEDTLLSKMPHVMKRQKLNHVQEPEKQRSEHELEKVRRRNEQKLQGRFSAIYAKYERDFGETSDEIDLVSGEVVVDNGHLKHMRHERDVGDRNPRALLKDQEEKDGNDDELASFSEQGQVSVWSDPETETTAESWSDFSDRVAAQVVNSAMHSDSKLDVSDPAFIHSFSINIMRQVAQVMQTMQTNRTPLNDLALPEINARKQLPPATTNHRKPRASGIQRRLHDPSDLDSERDQLLTDRLTPSNDIALVKSRSTPRPSIGRKPAFARITRRRYTAHENRLVIELMQRGEPDWNEARRKLPDRTEVAIRVQWGRLRRASKTKVKGVESASIEAPPQIEVVHGAQRRDQKRGDAQKTTHNADESQHQLSSAGVGRRPKKLGRKKSAKAAIPGRVMPTFQREKWSRSEDDRLVQLWNVQKLSLQDIASQFPGRSKGAISNRFRYRLYVNNREEPTEQQTDQCADDVDAESRTLRQSTKDEEAVAEADIARPELAVAEEGTRPWKNPTHEPAMSEAGDPEQMQAESLMPPSSASGAEAESPEAFDEGGIREVLEVEPQRQTLISGFQISGIVDCLEDSGDVQGGGLALVDTSLSLETDSATWPVSEDVSPSTTACKDDEDELTRDMVLTPPPSTTKTPSIRPSTGLPSSFQATPRSRVSTIALRSGSGGLSKAAATNIASSSKASGQLITPNTSSPSHATDSRSRKGKPASTGKLKSIRKRVFAAMEDDESEDELAR